ncbi:hypothetical protein K402DRAFT_118555 [Aulographum hederae CBS 113979]|uniref:Uncharacterized protein n=1 Tax=Aulographum hederae CBS 113979 TaxID=1176131 RepID=A0A6G1GWJ7_9PEZI|nr:hypothetical protein K402DRAFT_118555 [Aulographum hederae CBS 113979]
MPSTPARDADSQWTGPSTGHMLRTHTLAAETIARAYDSWPIFDAQNLDYLERWVRDPSSENRQLLLEEKGIVDEAGAKPGSAALEQGNLVGLCIARHGSDDEALTGEEIQTLRTWFEEEGDRIPRW